MVSMTGNDHKFQPQTEVRTDFVTLIYDMDVCISCQGSISKLPSGSRLNSPSGETRRRTKN